MAKIIRVLEHNDIIFKEDDYVLVTFENAKQIRGKIRFPVLTESMMVGEYDLSTYEIERIKHIKKLN